MRSQQGSVLCTGTWGPGSVLLHARQQVCTDQSELFSSVWDWRTALQWLSNWCWDQRWQHVNWLTQFTMWHLLASFTKQTTRTTSSCRKWSAARSTFVAHFEKPWIACPIDDVVAVVADRNSGLQEASTDWKAFMLVNQFCNTFLAKAISTVSCWFNWATTYIKHSSQQQTQVWK